MQPASETEIMPPAETIASALGADPPLFATDDRTEFARILAELRHEIEPQGATEEMYVSDVAFHVWEMRRLRRLRAVIMDRAFRDAVRAVVRGVLRQLGEPSTPEREARVAELAQRWSSDGAAKEEVRELLRRVNLDESAIEAESAILATWRVAELEKRQAALQNQREKTLSCLDRLRKKTGRKARAGAEQPLDVMSEDLRREIVEAALDDFRRLYETGELLRRSIDSMPPVPE